MTHPLAYLATQQGRLGAEPIAECALPEHKHCFEMGEYRGRIEASGESFAVGMGVGTLIGGLAGFGLAIAAKILKV